LNDVRITRVTVEFGDLNLSYPYRKAPQKDTKRYVFGRFIREPKVFCIDHEDINHGLIDTRDALRIAQDAGLELVMVSQGKNGNPSTCKILDFGKYKFEQEKRDKVTKKKQRENAVKIKEIKFRPVTDENDLKTKACQLQEFIDENNRLKITVVFRGREMAHREIGLEIITKFVDMISAKFEQEPSMTGRNLNAILIKKDTQS
jgi:translation initiation factor IF-3